MSTTGPEDHDPARREAVSAPPRRFRPELHGLRAVAVALVVVYHVWFNRVSGGVDVFFVITGFLLTGGLARAVERGPVPVARQWARSLGRLLPAAIPVLLVSIVVGFFVLPESRWLQTVREVVASALFLENWQLAADAVDYSASNNAASVVQHFWSLGIQAQVTVVVPALVALLALTARAAGAAPRQHLLIGLSVTFVLSLAYSVALTAIDQPFAYFNTLTRLWEFALGGILALVIDRIRLSARVRVRLGWLGLVGLVSCGLLLQVNSIFPGWVALWPTGCAALVLIAGRTGSRFGVDRFLSSAPLRRLADLSYPLYLWHWPVLVFTLVATRRETLGLLSGAAVIALSLGLALVTERLVERPMHNLDRGRLTGRKLSVVGLAVVLTASACWGGAAVQRTVTDGVLGDPDHPGAAAMHDAVATADLVPAPAAVGDDWVRIDEWDCRDLFDNPAQVCTLHAPGEPDVDGTPPEPTRRVVVVGDSHMQQFTGALAPIAESSGWELNVVLRGACPYSTESEVDPENLECVDWTEAASRTISAMHPDLVITLASRNVRAGLTETTPHGFVNRWWQLAEQGIPVLAVRDNPRFDHSPPDCLEQLGRGAAECGAFAPDFYPPDPPYAAVPDVPANVTFLDLAPFLCAGDVCPAEAGNVLVYLDDNHLTASFTRSLGPLVEPQVHSAFAW